MALKDFVALADDKLHDVFNRKPHNATKAREAMVKRLDKASEQFQATEPVRGRKLFKIQNGVVELTLPFEVAGKSVFHIPSERFADALSHLKASVNKGELDNELEAGSGKAAAEPGPRNSASNRNRDAPRYTEGSRSWSPERRAKFAATVAARKVRQGR